MNSPKTKKKILNFLKGQKIASLSTLSKDGTPQVATVYYGVDDDFNFYIVTGTKTRKYTNLRKNKLVTMAISDAPNLITVQLEGEASFLKKVKKNSTVVGMLSKILMPTVWESIMYIWEPVPPVIKMANGDLVVLKIEPKWLRYANFSISPHKKDNYFEVVRP